MRMILPADCYANPGAKAGTCSACPPSPRLMKVFAAPVKRFGPKNFRLRLWNRFAERLAVPLGLRSTNNVLPRRKGQSSIENGGGITASCRRANVLSKVWDTAFKDWLTERLFSVHYLGRAGKRVLPALVVARQS